MIVFASVLVLTVSAATAAYVYSQKSSSELFETNVDALTNSESGCGFAAYEYDNDWYEDTKNFQRCGDCHWVRGTQPSYTNC